jgi:hypothetical protein
MEREEELRILIDFLKHNIKHVANNCYSLLEDTIIKNGKLLEKYSKELEEICKNK